MDAMTENHQPPQTDPIIIVVGNEKGGSGKSTTVMHLVAGILNSGLRVGSLDLDARQATLSHYLQNRQDTIERTSSTLPMPQHISILPSKADRIEVAKLEDETSVAEAVATLASNNEYIVIDTPGSDSFLSRAGHSYADILVTPLNDSFVDLDVLANVAPETHHIKSPSQYAQMVFEQKIQKAKRGGANRTFDWVVMRNRLGQLDSRNQKAMDKAMGELSKRIGFRIAPGFSERVIFRELFLDGLTLLDLRKKGASIKLSMSHIAARQEVRNLLTAIGLPIDAV